MSNLSTRSGINYEPDPVQGNDSEIEVAEYNKSLLDVTVASGTKEDITIDNETERKTVEDIIDTNSLNNNDIETKHLSDVVATSTKEDTIIEKEVKDGEDDKDIAVDENQAPDGGWGWFIVLGALLLRTVSGGLARSHGLFYIKFKERYQGSATATALVTSLTGFLRLSGGPVVSIMSGRFRCRVLTTIGTVVMFVALILTAFSPSLKFLYFSYGVIAGIGRALILTPVPILLGYYFNKRRSLAFGLASAGFSLGGFAITPVVEILFQHYGYWGTFLILSGFALNILVASALFRPIEIHRKLISAKRINTKTYLDTDNTSLIFKSLEHIESGDVLGSSTISINGMHIKSRNGKANSDFQTKCTGLTCTSVAGGHYNGSKASGSVTIETDFDPVRNGSQKGYRSRYISKSDSNRTNASKNRDNVDQTESLLENKRETQNVSNKSETSNTNFQCCCLKRKRLNSNQETNVGTKEKKKSKLISWSVLKDTRFLCYVFAMCCITLPSSALFLPALAKSRGVSDLQAATLLSVSAGSDTLFRVISGVVLDLKIFRTIRPQIYNVLTLLQGIVAALFPSMTTYSSFIALSILDGAVQGIKNAQGTVVMLDMLGVDKLASSMAITMAVQCISVIVGPTIGGQLIDTYGNYDGAFYFGSGAILLGGLVMAGGNIAKHCTDRRVNKGNAHNTENR